MTNQEGPRFYSVQFHPQMRKGYILSVRDEIHIALFAHIGRGWNGPRLEPYLDPMKRKELREIPPLQILIETGMDPWHDPLTKEDKVRYEERVHQMKMETQNEKGDTE